MAKKNYRIRGILELFPVGSPWAYILIPDESIPDVKVGGWGSIPVIANIGNTTWQTSLFPMKGNKYFIPIKKKVRESELLQVGKEVVVEYRVV
ncbi:MAG: DUF1905 domain-containing protein [Candidatus Colwellbacteria bacterium CG10_big_fil_rev_8_21_14_0_10_42_22]|uniref:DUF1905 domain-containing protein n=1 Tax=Candidatus Colwellbacteria bacterium CG10_big_fil_rev_8_21_14_0_10_42_22 TaxID=1974540 RepID=A0A2H0VGQ7_9BACT|nr:MAG: DUF1905 domain-containing protein [Candidatus Colwellbacteria bacterium CG10_big_fil_rev_8_21_14_0_10_42_22]